MSKKVNQKLQEFPKIPILLLKYEIASNFVFKNKYFGKHFIAHAYWGSLDVTGKARKFYDEGQRKFLASNEVWSDGDYGVAKTLFMVLKVGNNRITHRVAFEYGEQTSFILDW